MLLYKLKLLHWCQFHISYTVHRNVVKWVSERFSCVCSFFAQQISLRWSLLQLHTETSFVPLSMLSLFSLWGAAFFKQRFLWFSGRSCWGVSLGPSWAFFNSVHSVSGPLRYQRHGQSQRDGWTLDWPVQVPSQNNWQVGVDLGLREVLFPDTTILYQFSAVFKNIRIIAVCKMRISISG